MQVDASTPRRGRDARRGQPPRPPGSLPRRPALSCQLPSSCSPAGSLLRVGKMSKRRGDCLSSNKNKKACKSRGKTRNVHLYNASGEEFGSSSDYKLSQEIVSNLSETVVSLASFIGDRILALCTGIVVKNDEFGIRVLTSAILLGSSDNDNFYKIFPELRIKVWLPNNQSAIGWLLHYDFHCNVAVVNMTHYPGFRAAHFDPDMQLVPCSKVVALGRCFNTGKLIAVSGTVADQSSSGDREHLMMSTCKITLAMAGGPLVDLDGNFVGMNFYSKERTPFLPRNTIYKWLVDSGTIWVEIEHGGYSTIENINAEGSSIGENKDNQKLSTFSQSDSEVLGRSSWGSEIKNRLSISSTSDSEDESECLDDEDEDELLRLLGYNPLPVDEFTELVKNDLKSRQYPMPIRFEGGMCLINTFEEEFAEDTWSKLSKKVASNISRSVVSLASFKGEERFFACTGIFIDNNESTSRVLTSASLVRTSAEEYKIVDNLKIQVYLPNKRLAVGTLHHYNLSYNIAVVSIVGFRCLRTAEFYNQMQVEPYTEVVAIGRSFESGKLMATSGIIADKESKLDCKELMISTCKITKAGIGGPLVDSYGNFIGMNFYGMKETHYLPRSIILEQLRNVDNKACNEKRNRWPVPEPRWSYPSAVRRPRPCERRVKC